MSTGSLGEKRKKDQEAETSKRVIDTLRAEMIQSSEVTPEEESIAKTIDIKLIALIGTSFIIFVIILFLITGSRRQVIAKGLAGLFSWEVTRVNEMNLTPSTQNSNSVSIAPALIASATLQPTKTQTMTIPPTQTSSPTQQKPTIPPVTESTSTPVSSCREASSITLEDVGKTLCVYGTIIETVEKSNNFMVIFSHERGAFYWVTYDLVWSKGEVDNCYQTTGKIDQIANTPVLVFGYANLPEKCP